MDVKRNEIEQALAKEQFALHYQPKVSLVTGEITGAEALVRWTDDQYRTISPDHFIPIAEESGLISDITAHLIPTAITTLKTLCDRGSNISIALNTSADDFVDTRITSLLQQSMDRSGITPQRLQIEITETAKLDGDDAVSERLHDLRSSGFQLIMDDFGTGYASIDLLGRLPFSALKVDQGVINRMGGSAKNLNIVNMIINLARTLRMHVVAEGVEDSNAFRFLSYAGCAEAQGFWICRPLPEDEFLAFVRSGPRWPSSQLGMIYHAQMNNIYFHKSVLDAALYAACGIRDEMSAVTNPDIESSPESTRLGEWYYGAGQELRDRASFRAIEEPHRNMHDAGAQFLQQATEGRHEEFSRMLEDFNRQFELVSSALNSLQAELVAEEPFKQNQWGQSH